MNDLVLFQLKILETTQNNISIFDNLKWQPS